MFNGFGYCPVFKKESAMGLYNDMGLDSNIDRNSFTKEDAAKVFEMAFEKIKSGEATAEFLDELLDAGFNVLRILAMFA